MDTDTRNKINRLNERVEELESEVEELEAFKDSIINILWHLNVAVTPFVEFEMKN